MSGCTVCDTKKSEGYYVMSYDIIKTVAECTKKEAIAKGLEPFLQIVNSMINSDDLPPEEAEQAKKEEKPKEKPGTKRGQKSWKILLHTEKPHLLGDFDKKVDDKLVKLIPDDSHFDEMVFRYFLQNEKHVVYEITQRGGNHSTLEFHSKVSLNRGLSDPTHAQIHRFLSRGHDISDDEKTKRSKQKPPEEFVKGTIVKMQAAGSTSLVPFQECVSLQAKPSKLKHRATKGTSQGEHGENRLSYLVKWWWEEQQLREFISAFTKLPQGGSIFLGVGEVVDGGKQTGKFTPQGIVLNENEQSTLRKHILDLVEKEMVCIPTKSAQPDKVNPGPANPTTSAQQLQSVRSCVEINFIRVRDAPAGECVVEVKVKHFLGLCFFKKEGPVSYKFRGNKVDKVEQEEWRKLTAEAGKRKTTDHAQAGPSTPKKKKI